jgi:hypothetical protein
MKCQKFLSLITGLVLVVLALAGCSTSAVTPVPPTTTANAPHTPTATPTPIATSTATVAVTYALTATPTPTQILTPSVGPRPGQWGGQGDFTGSFRVESDRVRITSFVGSFRTKLCGNISVPGDLTPPAEIPISNNKVRLLMNIPDTVTFLLIDGTFSTEASLKGEYSWGIEKCGLGLTRIVWGASWQGD